MEGGEINPRLKRAVFELRRSGANPGFGNPLRSGIHSRGYLPHVKREGAAYFVTFRLADSLPGQVLLKFQAQRAERLHRLTTASEAARRLGVPFESPETIKAIDREHRQAVERFLDQSIGGCLLARPEIAYLVAEAIQFFDGRRYRLDAWVIMPNHVHAVLWPMPNHSLSEILKSWKRFTSRQANLLLKRTGQTFWQPESFDHWIRDDEEHARCCHYTIQNPVKARLCRTPEDWKWSSAWRGS